MVGSSKSLMRLCALLMAAAALTSCAPPVQEPSTLHVARDEAPARPELVPLSMVRAAPGPGRVCERRHPGRGAVRLHERRSSSAVALVKSGAKTLAYVADADAKAIYTMDVDARRVLASTLLPGTPAHLLVLADGRVAVTLRDLDRMLVLEPQLKGPLRGLCEITTPVEPFALAETTDSGMLLVTGAWSGRLTGHDARTFEPRFEVALDREPREIEVIGTKAFVAHVVGGRVSAVDLAPPHGVRTIDLRRPRFDAALRARLGQPREDAQGSQGFALTTIEEPDRLFAPHVMVEPDLTVTYYAQGGETPVATAIDPASERVLARGPVAVDMRARRAKGRCLLPRAAEVSAERKLYVTCLGNDLLMELDARAADPARMPLRQWGVEPGPLGLAIDDAGGRAIVWSQFARKLTIMTLGERFSMASISAPDLQMSEAVQLGRELFHLIDDPRITVDGRGCASCHPDGRDDALVWPTQVGMRQTITLAGRMEASAPYGWNGEHATLAEHALETAKRLGGRGLEQRGADAIAAYLKSLPAPRALHREPELVDRGRDLFFGVEQQCARCHVDGGTDRVGHDLGTGGRIDTPSLRGVGRTAPYLHDGRYTTLAALIESPQLRMGHVSHLGPLDRVALVAYLESL